MSAKQRRTRGVVPPVEIETFAWKEANVADQNTPSAEGQGAVLDAATGVVREKLDVTGGVAARRRALGPPVITNGRLCVETFTGVAIYGGQ